jgi:hypothetical protein
MATIGWLKIGVTTDTSQFKAGLAQSAKAVDSFKSTLLATGATIAGALGISFD